MYKKLITALSIVTLTVFLIPACAEQDNGAEASPDTATTDVVESAPAAEKAELADGESVSVLDQPVDFSTAENVEKSIEKVRQEMGDSKARQLSIAMKYILTYDLSVGHDKEKMYKKLNGSTPNEIIAMMKR